MPPDLSILKNEAPPGTPPPPPNQERPRHKLRTRFRKAGNLRLVSHHDLMHVVERMFRRADLQLSVSQGFNPRPKMAFALSLALGVAGLNEVLEFETPEPLDPQEVQERLARQSPPGLEILSVRAIDWRSSARVRRSWYRLGSPLPLGEGLGVRVETFLHQTECWTERTRPHPRRVNVRPFVSEMHYQNETLSMALWITPTGAARPEEVIAALGLSEALEAGTVLERTDLELYDELPPGIDGPPPIEGVFQEITPNATEMPTASRPTAIFDSPMSFDS